MVDGTQPQKIVCNPVFRSREYPLQSHITCFVLMPYKDKELEDVYLNIVKPTIENLEIRCIRGDDISGVVPIMEDIWSAICRADFLVGDFSGKNGNVLYEAGIANTLGKPLICLTQFAKDIPFDFRHIRHIVYKNSLAGGKKLGEDIKKTIKTLALKSPSSFPQPLPQIDREREMIQNVLIEDRKHRASFWGRIERRMMTSFSHFHRAIASFGDRQPKPTDGKNAFDQIEFCKVEGGRVNIDRYSFEKQKPVNIGKSKVQPFRISKYPITQRDYSRYIKETLHPPPEDWTGVEPPSSRKDHPVVGVSWVDIAMYCQWLSNIANRIIGIPTEAEWLAASGYGLDGRLFPWGNNWKEDVCNSGEKKLEKTTPVDAFEGLGDSPYGCVDMVGNTWEWLSDFAHNTSDLEFGWRAARGGAYYRNLKTDGILARTWCNPGHFLFVCDLGFRVKYLETH